MQKRGAKAAFSKCANAFVFCCTVAYEFGQLTVHCSSRVLLPSQFIDHLIELNGCENKKVYIISFCIWSKAFKLRVDESSGRMGCLYCSIVGTIYRGEDPPRAGGQGERRPGGGGSTRGCASPNPNPNGLWQPIRVRPAARGRQQPAARVAPPKL
jgi:hypothetical protein